MSVHVAWKQFKAIVHIRQTKKGCSEFTAKDWENNETALDDTAPENTNLEHIMTEEAEIDELWTSKY